MGKFSSSSSKKAKKSKKSAAVPKGKRARAKAKLERQWGEQPIIRRDKNDEDEKHARRRRGVKTSTTTQVSTTQQVSDHKEEYETTNIKGDHHDDNDNDDDESMNDDPEDTNTTTITYSNQLVQSIQQSLQHRKKKKNQVRKETEDDSNSISSGEQQEKEDETSHSSVINDDDHSKQHESIDVWIPTTNPFTERFVQHANLVDEKSNKNNKEDPNTTTKISWNIQSKTQQPHVYTLDWTLSQSLLEKYRMGSDTMPDSAVAMARAHKLLQSFHVHNNNYKNNNNKTSRKPTPFRTGISGQFVRQLVPFLSAYADLGIWTSELGDNYRQKYTFRNDISRIVQVHIVNHVLRSRCQILQHNRQKANHNKMNNDNDDDDNDRSLGDDTDALSLRDQGFTRPTVLVLLPTRSCCWDFIQNLLSELLGDRSDGELLLNRVDGMERFQTEYGTPNKETEQDKDDDVARRRKTILRQKGPAWNELFGGDRNDDDDFQIGIQINLTRNKKAVSTENPGVKLFADYFKSDVIVASPLALKMTIDDESDEAKADILSSIEICVIERAEVMLMQNWDHVNDVLSRLNQHPRAMNNTDFSRVRPYFLTGQSEKWRQLIVTSEFMDPNILSTFKRFAKSSSGTVKIKRSFNQIEDASISSLVLRTRQIFQRVSCSSFANQGSDRLKHFLDKILPFIERNKQNHTMIFIPSYFDFVSLRNALLKRQEDLNGIGCIDFVSVTEYARSTEVSRGRARFLQGRKSVMLYTGRAHFFLRHAIKGARHIIFLGIPEYSDFYPELVNSLGEGLRSNDQGIDESLTLSSTCTVLFTKYESHALERIVGSSNCSRMVKGDKSTFVFSSS
jgi:U3 small nucleolar RNA-associated protein 25